MVESFEATRPRQILHKTTPRWRCDRALGKHGWLGQKRRRANFGIELWLSDQGTSNVFNVGLPSSYYANLVKHGPRHRLVCPLDSAFTLKGLFSWMAESHERVHLLGLATIFTGTVSTCNFLLLHGSSLPPNFGYGLR